MTYCQIYFQNFALVSNDVFELFKSQFDYNNYPLNANVVLSNTFQEGYTLETFSMVAPYESKEEVDASYARLINTAVDPRIKDFLTI